MAVLLGLRMPMGDDMKSDTPRTDDKIREADYWHDDGHRRAGWIVPADFARQLERENADLRARLEQAEARCKQLEGIAFGAFFEGWKCGSPVPHHPPLMFADWESSQTKQALSPEAAK